jgi:predicted DNA-binding transcriptional regulator AlpA
MSIDEQIAEDALKQASSSAALAAAAGILKPSAKRGVKRGSKRSRAARPISGALADDEVMLTMEETQVFFGGPTRPIHSSTLYRGVANGVFPRPVWIGPNSVRWLKSECVQARQKLIDGRGKLRVEHQADPKAA